jgi:type VI secretion system protein ImpA
MPTAALVIDTLLDPIPSQPPCGKDLRWTAEWDRIKEARRADDGLDAGKWAKKERKAANWRLVEEVATSILRTQSKDLQIAMWLTEANLKLYGFAGLADGFRLVRELIDRYWDEGLFPTIEDGPEDRAGPLAWLNDKLADSIAALPITRRSDQDIDYSFLDLQDARRVGSEAGYKTADGEIDERKKREYDAAIATGHISMEMFQRAVKETDFALLESLQNDFAQVHEEFKALEKVIDAKFGDAAPNLAACRTILGELQHEISTLVEKKRKDQPIAPAVDKQATTENASEHTDMVTVRFPLSGFSSAMSGSPMAGSWQEAERLVRSGQVDAGLAEMTRLAATETSGRNRFQRKLLLAEVCIASKREPLARAILEELAEQIDKFQLEIWETSELVCSVWTRLYGLYKHGDQPDADRARKLYDRLCRLDPWQALGCGD